LKTVIITGGAGFIGSAVIRYLIEHRDYRVVNFDKLTYAGNLESLVMVEDHPNYHFEHGDICDHLAVSNLFNEYQPDAIMHLAAESHVDRSIDGPAEFINTNIITFRPMKSSARLAPPACFTNKARINPIPRTRPARPRPTTWCAPGMKPMACRW
jgi:dTDP-glucose 4,6-dehydratase